MAYSAEDKAYLNMHLAGTLVPGAVSHELFSLLSDISSIHSERILMALRIFLVEGKTRQEACELSGISQSCFSTKLRQLQVLSCTVARMYSWYVSETEGKKQDAVRCRCEASL